jgi:hypothetical protein
MAQKHQGHPSHEQGGKKPPKTPPPAKEQPVPSTDPTADPNPQAPVKEGVDEEND